ncbi:MAG: hypothetical protein K0S55_440 [Clostridia bacterium]|nr:hypothetical protein [Clostridia bacterium]
MNMVFNVDDKTKKIDPAALEKAINILKQSLSEKEVAKLEETFNNKNNLNALASKFSDKQLEDILKIVNNPAMMQKILSSPKARDGLKNFLK